MAVPKYFTEIDTHGSGTSATSVSRQSSLNIAASATMSVKIVSDRYITDGPIIIRTALRSLVARDMRSPVRFAWKYAASSVCRCAKNSLRMSYSISRETPVRIRRMRNRKYPANTPMPSSTAA